VSGHGIEISTADSADDRTDDADGTGHFAVPLSRLAEPFLAGLAARLDGLTGLGRAERVVVRDAAGDALLVTLERRLTRLLVLELNAARITGRLRAPSSRARWAEFLDLLSEPGYWRELTAEYPTLRSRLDTLIGNRCAAALDLAGHFAAERADLAVLLGRPAGELLEVRLGAGDSHRGGRTVARLRCAGGRVLYKPRSVAVDLRLQTLLDAVLDGPPATRIRVPRALDRGDHGWVEHVSHRYCADAAELTTFYRGIGHWLAIMRLVGGSDLHAENLIACGPVPVVVDCETLFTPHQPIPPTGFGLAFDLATDLVDRSVLRTGLLPHRGVALGWRGADMSASGSLPGEQPTVTMPVLVDAGTDRARIERISQVAQLATDNHPSREALVARHWPDVLAGFDELGARLAELDRAGRLDELMTGFADCPTRVVVRATEVYVELGRMLWHPVSLHDEATATRRATELLVEQAVVMPAVPTDPDVVAAEVADLVVSDVPFFTTTPATGRMAGPGGTTWGPRRDLVDDTLRRWRGTGTGTDTETDRQVIKGALISAYINEGGLPRTRRLGVTDPDRGDAADLDRRRRAVVASLVDRLAESALHGSDGTVIWVAPSLSETGWGVQPLGPDLYNGLAGLACLFAAHRHEVRAGRVDQHPAVDGLYAAVLRSIRAGEDVLARRRGTGTPMRPGAAGGYLGVASQLSSWLFLDELGDGDTPDAVDRARAHAALLPDAIAADEWFDVTTGMAGAIEPLLRLAARTGEHRWTELADHIGDRLADAAVIEDGRACWPNAKGPRGLGGFSHGSSGIGWALNRLAERTGRDRQRRLAAAAFAFEDALWSPAHGGWLDLRPGAVVAHSWCNGSAGIGLAAADGLRTDGLAARHRRVLTRAADACWNDLGWTHTLCHGDLGNRDLLQAAVEAGVEPPGLTMAELDARLLTSIERHGPTCDVPGAASPPALFTGISGIAYQLLRMHPAGDLPSLLLRPRPVPARSEHAGRR
jgi:type 2 lantibiotic biosynthesis protein LanM